MIFGYAKNSAEDRPVFVHDAKLARLLTERHGAPDVLRFDPGRGARRWFEAFDALVWRRGEVGDVAYMMPPGYPARPVSSLRAGDMTLAVGATAHGPLHPATVIVKWIRRVGNSKAEWLKGVRLLLYDLQIEPVDPRIDLEPHLWAPWRFAGPEAVADQRPDEA